MAHSYRFEWRHVLLYCFMVRTDEWIAMPLSPDDSYHLPDGRMVMTAAYHIKRGFCCHQHCRHCPYPLPPHGTIWDASPRDRLPDKPCPISLSY
ncbi:hypothetical protein EBZ35_05105 [bacterium]|nr:hypothetical protein [bacterium]